MVLTFCLVACTFAAFDDPGGAEWQITPRLARGEELLYRGSYTEETTGRGVQFTRTQKLETRVFIMDATPRGLDAAILSIVRDQRARTVAGSEAAEPVSLRLEVISISPKGKVTTPSGAPLMVPLEGAAPIEASAFVELPRVALRSGDMWETVESGRPARSWKVAGTETVTGTSCIKLVGVQQSDDWDHSRGDRSAWRRVDTIWLAPNLGAALRIERVIEHREPARRDPSQKTVTQYTLDNRMVYPDQLAEDRRREVQAVHQLVERVKPFLAAPEKANGKLFDEVLGRIHQHMEKQPATPYRQALTQLQRRVEAASRGEAVLVEYNEDAAPAAPVMTTGQPAPDFVATDLTKREATRLRKLLGRPILLVFYNPSSRNAADILRYAQSVLEAHREVTVLGLAIFGETDQILKQRDDLKLTFPLLAGQGLRFTYAVEATPKFVVLDAQGIVRGSYTGWGRELPTLVNDELSRAPEKPGSK
jgi:peroxiredoxin